VSAPQVQATFTERLLLLPTHTLPEGGNWAGELDGYRVRAINTDGKVHLRSRNNTDFHTRYDHREGARAAPDESGRPSSNTLQNDGSANVQIITFSAQRRQR
jgi:ATP-dependent DNA ligase